MWVTKTLDGPFGAEVIGADIARDIDPAAMCGLLDLLYEHHVLVIRRQELTKPQYSRFGHRWGEPIKFFKESHLDPEFPDLIRISNSPQVPERQHNGAAFWHTDGSYEYVPASITMLYALEAPEVGGETMFIDMAAAYDALPAETKARIDGMQVRHMIVGGKRIEGETPLRPFEADVRHKQETEKPVHPLVLAHPVTGRKALYAVSGTANGIVGMPDDEAEALLISLKRHAIQPQFRLTCKACRGDLLIWDNLATMHSATPTEYTAEEGKRRSLLRFSTTGLPPLYADRTPAFVR
jgi:taurine dioxygenase